jgi:tripartite-type tricarboxylate transporter receptor subunit TctC
MMRTHVIQYRLRTAGALAVAMLACAPRVASAQPADQFFKGKVINLYIGFAAGGSYDYYARLVARFIGKNIPGNPTVVAQTMAGAGSFQAANFLFAVAPRDGCHSRKSYPRVSMVQAAQDGRGNDGPRSFDGSS